MTSALADVREMELSRGADAVAYSVQSAPRLLGDLVSDRVEQH